MTERTGGNTFLAFVAGALLVLALAIGWMVWSGGLPMAARAPQLDISVPEAPNLPAPAPNPEPTPMPTPVPKPG